MIEQVAIAIVIAIVVGALLVYLFGPIVKTIPAPVAQIVGDFFVKWGWAIGLLAGVLAFFGHWSIAGFGGGR